jgi:L-rhamnose-H+ transport protein
MIALSQPVVGLGIVMFSGVLTASFPLPMKLSQKWKWENTWLVYATLALVVIPVGLAGWAVPHLLAFYSSIPPQVFLLPLLFGFGWGIAQVTFGISIARVGMAMAFAIVIGMSAVLGSVIPLAAFHPTALVGRTGVLFLVSAAFLVVGLVFYTRAGRGREASLAANGSSGKAFLNGLILCIFTGLFGSMLNMGFVFGNKIAELAVLRGVSAQRATLCVWAVVLAAGYLPNAAYTLYLLQRNRTAGEFSRSFIREPLLSLSAAILWLFGMLGYGLGASAMGVYGNSIGFAVCMAVLLLWSTALGTLAGEWRGAPSRARLQMLFAVACITASMLALGFDSLLH